MGQNASMCPALLESGFNTLSFELQKCLKPEQEKTPYQQEVCNSAKVIDYQRKKFKNEKLRLDEMGFQELKAIGDNFFTHLANKTLTILKIQGTNMRNIVITVKNTKQQKVVGTIEAGQMFAPYDDLCETQSLICTQDLTFDIIPGQNQFSVPTMCYDRQRKIPCGQQFVIANFKSVDYKVGMTQQQVWQISFDIQSKMITKTNQIPLKIKPLTCVLEDLINQLKQKQSNSLLVENNNSKKKSQQNVLFDDLQCL